MTSLTETAMLAEAVIQAAATEDLGIKYCEELMIVGHNLIRVYRSSKYMTRAQRRRLDIAFCQLEELLGQP